MAGNHRLTLNANVSDRVLKCIIFFVLGYGSNNPSSGTTHRNGTRMGSSIYAADEINARYFNDAGLVRVRRTFLLNCFSMWICEGGKNRDHWAKHIIASSDKIIFSEQVPIFAVFKRVFYGLIWPIHKNAVKPSKKHLKGVIITTLPSYSFQRRQSRGADPGSTKCCLIINQGSAPEVFQVLGVQNFSVVKYGCGTSDLRIFKHSSWL